MKKTTCLMLVVIMITMLFPVAKASDTTTALANATVDVALDILEQEYISSESTTASSSIAVSLINCYRDDPVFKAHFQADPADAIAMVVQVIQSSMTKDSAVQPLWTDGTVYSADGVPTYKQSQSNSCGAASALQVIIQQGGGNNVSGSTNTAKEKTLIGKTELNKNGSVLVIEVRDLINNHTNRNKYAYIPCLNLNETDFRRLVLNSLAKDCPIILHANTKYLGYYNSVSLGHYIVGTTFYPATDQFVVNDCNYDSAYTGIRITSMSEVWSSVHNPNANGSSRYLIYGT